MNQPETSKENIRLSVIVLFYHGQKWLKPCIDSLENQSLSRTSYEILLVDNGGSTPAVGAYDKQPNIKVITFPRNLGFAGGNNAALMHAEGEFVLLMNQDVIVHYGCLEEIVHALYRNPRAGVVSANMQMVSKNDRIKQSGPLPGITGHYKLTRLGYARYYIRESCDGLIAADFVSGNALGLRRRILQDIGGYLFDHRLGSYAEDLDLSLRLRHSTWDMLVHPRALVYHFRDDAFSGSPMKRLRKLLHISSNRLVVYYNNLTIAAFLMKLPALMLGIPFKVIRSDSDGKINLLNFLVALGCTPFIVSYFLLKILLKND